MITAVAVGVILVPAVVILLFQSVRAEQNDNRVRDQLKRDGVVTVGTVMKVTSPNRWNVFPSTAGVNFATDGGQAVSTRVPVSHRPEEGARVDIRYSRSKPSVARLAGDATPNHGRWKLVAIGFPVFAAGFVLAVTWLERRRDRREGSPSYWTGAGSPPSS